mgnify:CR=1 FL=1
MSFDDQVVLSLDEATFVASDGIRYLDPAVGLGYKSRHRRPKDEADFARCLPLLSADQRELLTRLLTRISPDHPWLTRLAEPRG